MIVSQGREAKYLLSQKVLNSSDFFNHSQTFKLLSIFNNVIETFSTIFIFFQIICFRGSGQVGELRDRVSHQETLDALHTVRLRGPPPGPHQLPHRPHLVSR